MPNFEERWPDMRMKHLEMLQALVVRMSVGSERMKASCVAIVTAVVALATSVETSDSALYAAPVVLLLAILDARYLSLERAFRRKFNKIRRSPLDSLPDFDLEPDVQRTWWASLASLSVWPFYLAVLGFSLAAFWLLRN